MSLVALSVCNECIHEPVCSFKERYAQQVIDLRQYPYESYVQATVNCEHWASKKLTTSKRIGENML
jgi:hypothetical protein